MKTIWRIPLALLLVSLTGCGDGTSEPPIDSSDASMEPRDGSSGGSAGQHSGGANGAGGMSSAGVGEMTSTGTGGMPSAGAGGMTAVSAW